MSFDRVSSLISSEFDLGGSIEIAAVPAGAAMSNIHFVAHVGAERFFVKQIRDPAALFGGAGIPRLEAVSEALSLLADRIAIERPLRTKQKNFVATYTDVALRVMTYVDGRRFMPTLDDARAAARAGAALHERGIAALTPAVLADIEAIRFAYPLRETAPRFDELVEYARHRASDMPGLAAFVEHANELRQHAARALATMQGTSRSLIHLDLHPDNVLFDRDGDAVIIDADNMMIGDAGKCTTFSIMRFATALEMSVPALSKLWAEWIGAPQSELSERVIETGIALEVEKILRITARVKDTGAYASFLDNIATKHLPSIANLLRARA